MAAWSQSDRTSNMVLSDGNLRATAGANAQWVRGDTSKGAGKWFYSFKLTVAPVKTILGFSNGGSIGGWVGDNTNSFGVFNNGYGSLKSTYPKWGDPFGNGSVVDLAYDTVAGCFWYRINGGKWNASLTADPSTGVGGHNVSVSPLGTVLPIFWGNSKDAGVVSFGPTFVYASPSGYSTFATTVAPDPEPEPVPVPVGRAKIGIGCWEEDNFTMLGFVEQMQFGWYYNWRPDHLQDTGGVSRTVQFVPMIWGENDINKAPQVGSTHLLGFNEPDGTASTHQANLSVDKAISLWPKVMAHGLRLGSPGTTQKNTFGVDKWQTKFMAKARTLGYRVDFMAVHYYSINASVADFKAWLEQVYAAYSLPVWITEWCLVDWGNPGKFSATANAAFAREAVPMLDAMPFVERHAWFAAGPYDLFGAPTHLVDANRNMTVIGTAFADMIA